MIMPVDDITLCEETASPDAVAAAGTAAPGTSTPGVTAAAGTAAATEAPAAGTHGADAAIGTPATSIDTATGEAAPAELSSDRVREIFSAIAKKYERFNAVSSFGAYKLWLKGMMAQADIPADASVLDIAGGTGDVTFTVAQTKHPVHIQCTDLVQEMLDVAMMHYSDGAADGVPVDFQVVDAQDIPYEDESYDVITMAYGIRNMPKRQQALSEMFRVLRPGGQLVCLDFSTPPNPIWRGLYHFYLKYLIPFWGKIVTGDASGFIYLAKSIRAFPNQQGLAALMEEAGFTDVTWKNYTGGIAAVHVAHKPAHPE